MGLGEGGKGAGPNKPTVGEGRWNGVGRVRDACWQEDGWGVGDEGSSFGEIDCMGRGEETRREDE